MDSVRETQKSFDNLLDNEDDSSDDAYWVEVAWKREDALDICQNGVRERIHDNRVESFEIYRKENLRGLAGPTGPALETLSEKKGVDVALLPQEAQKSRQSVSLNDSGSLVEQGHFRSPISRETYKCDLGCDIPAFKYPKDLYRHINDVHETRTRYMRSADFLNIDLEWFLVVV